jgi:lipopolysaccharide export system permease protein
VNAISGYITRTSFGAFAMVLVSLTTVIWLTQALREVDLITNQGQTVLIFVGMTSLLIPTLIMVIAPLAFMIALAYTLNKLNSDSEIIVMNAAGMSPWRIFRPFLAVSVMVAIMTGCISAYIAPKALRELRTMLFKVRADVITNVLQPGRFAQLDGGKLTLHIRERRANGELSGIFIDDRRDPVQRATFLAERGQTIENESGSFLVLEQGSAQRLDARERDPTIILFERYAFDLTQFSVAGNAQRNVATSERPIWDLAWPDPDESFYKQNVGRFRADLHDRLVAPIYPIVFCFVAFAVLGAPRTTRQSRGVSLAITITAVMTLRMIGFACIVFAAKAPEALFFLYGSLVLAVAGSAALIARGAIVEPPAFLVTALNNLQSRRLRTVPAGGAASSL